MTPDTATQCSARRDLRSMLKRSPASPRQRVKGLACALMGLTMVELAEQVIQTDRTHLYRVIDGERPSPPLRRRIARLFGLDESDIWPPDDGESLPHSLPHPGAAHTDNPGQEVTR